jgi:hypothetical protein
MRRSYVIPVGVLLVLGGVANSYSGVGNEGNASAQQEATYTVRAGPVAKSGMTAAQGTFQVHRSGAPAAIPSSRLAGACLIFPAADLGFTRMAAKQCRKDADCATPGENLDGTCDVETNQCWSKPAGAAAAGALCNRGLVAPEGKLIPVPVQPAYLQMFNISPGTRVRVRACLNKSGIIPSRTGCLALDGPDRVTDMGPVTRVR